VAESICVALEAMAKRDGHRGSFNAYIEGCLSKMASDLYVPEGRQAIQRIIELQEMILLKLAAGEKERVSVKGYRPAKESHERQERKVS
jgi:hypothetical protein